MDIENRELKGSNPSLRKVFLLNNKTTNTMSTQRAVNHTKQSQLFSSRKLNLVTLFLFFGILFFSSKSFAQNLENESRIIEYLGEERYFELTQKNPAYLNFIDARYSHGYSVMDYVDEKMNDFPILEVIYHSAWATVNRNGKECVEVVESKVTPEEFLIALESEEFNFLEYRFTFDRTQVTYHVLGNTGKVIMIASIENINHIVNAEN